MYGMPFAPLGKMQGDVCVSGGGLGGLQPERVNVGGSTTVIVAVCVAEDWLIEDTFRVIVMLLLAGSMGGV
jgi:hypothetical protein